MLWRKNTHHNISNGQNTRKHACENDNHIFNLLFFTMLHKLDAATIATVLQSKRADFVVLKVFCYIHKNIQEGSILSLWEGTTSTCTALWEVTCCHVIQVCHYGFI